MESLKAPGSTYRLTGLPLTSWLSVESLWQVRQSSVVGFGAGLDAACRVPSEIRIFRATAAMNDGRILIPGIQAPLRAAPFDAADTLEIATSACRFRVAFRNSPT